MTNHELQEKLGKATEKLVVKTFKKFKYWAYLIPKKTGGQPCDIVAAKKDKVYLVWLVDAKHVREQDVSFDFDRVEANQITSMRYARDFSGMENLGFVIFFDRDKQLRYLPFEDYENFAKNGIKSVNMNNLALFAEVLTDADNNQ